MELRHLRYFAAVAAEEHVRRASENLRVAQPAVTRQIADLEDELGFPLFDRLPRGIRLNAAGKQFLSDTTKILSSVEAAIRNAERASKGQLGLLKIGFIEPASWLGVFPTAVHQYRSRFPQVNLQLTPMSSKDQMQAIATGELDAGFCYTFEQTPANCEATFLRNDRVLLAVPQRYGWRKRRNILLANLADEPFIWFKRSVAPKYLDALGKAIAISGFTPHVVQEVQDESTMLSLVAAGIGIGFVNSANEGRKPQAVDFVQVTDLDVALPLHFVKRANSPSPVVREFCEVITHITSVRV